MRRRLVQALLLLPIVLVRYDAMCAQVDDSFGDLVLAEDEDVEQTTPIASALPCTTPPVIDGSLADATWEEANRFPGFIDNTSRRYAANQTFVCVAYDA